MGTKTMDVRERFESDTKDHEMQILRSDGVDRHLRFRKGGDFAYAFDILTWPGHLCISGDCGTYVFARIEDMFQFFGGRDIGSINPHYWSEKLLSVDRADGYIEWDPDAFAQAIWLQVEDWQEGPIVDDELRDRIDDEILSRVEEGKQAAYSAAMEFEIDGELPFQDFWEVNTDKFTLRFLWCCHAIVWAIKKFRAAGQ